MFHLVDGRAHVFLMKSNKIYCAIKYLI
uniref:Pab-dependent poly-specific ribonuclease subunit pan3 n=1 Tax=Triatoma infestans TaxID=30076 RepID=A0A161M569_TRIIF